MLFWRGQPEAWQSLALSLTIWFGVDSGYSLISEFWQNAVLNGVFFAGFAIPLAATRRFF